MNLDNVSREDWIVGGLALLLVISLLFFPWYSISAGPFSIDRSAASSPYAIWGLLAMLVALAFIADLAVQRLSPQTVLPSIGGSRATTRLAIAGAVLVLLLIKFVAHVGDFGWGFFLDVIAVAALVYFAIQARNAAPVAATVRSTPGSGPPASSPPPSAP